MGMGNFMMEVWVFMKRFWFLPVVTVLVLLGIVLTQASAVAPFIYPLF
jgi:hypothetical protein